jgi:hypothetical protein
MPRIATHGILDVSLLVRQLKYKGFICNALDCLNKENKSFSNSLFLLLYLIFFSYSLALCLCDDLDGQIN